MPFSVQEFHDLVRLLEQHPEWRAELRRLLLTEEVLALPQVVRELAEAQRRTEQRLEELAAAQARTEARVEELAEAQRRTEERIGQLEAAVARLAEAQLRTEDRLTRLEALHQETMRHLGALANLVGADIEQDARDVLVWILRQKGWRLGAEPIPIALDGEVDLAAPVETPDGRRLWVLVEVKLRLRRREVLAWVSRLRDPTFTASLAEEGVQAPWVSYAFGLRVYSDAEQAAREVGIGVLDVHGERVPPVGP